jgi:hypothetical protein
LVVGDFDGEREEAEDDGLIESIRVEREVGAGLERGEDEKDDESDEEII